MLHGREYSTMDSSVRDLKTTSYQKIKIKDPKVKKSTSFSKIKENATTTSPC
jgi:hypothetical protein